jgi:hypothetical protein
MKRILITGLLVLSVSATPALAGPTLKQRLAATKATVVKLQGQLKKARAQHERDVGKIADGVQAERARSTTISQRDGQILALQEQIGQRTREGVATVLAGSPADIFSAVQQIWDAFPKLPFGQTCGGYDKSSSLTVYADKSAASTWTFSLQPCQA